MDYCTTTYLLIHTLRMFLTKSGRRSKYGLRDTTTRTTSQSGLKTWPHVREKTFQPIGHGFCIASSSFLVNHTCHVNQSEFERSERKVDIKIVLIVFSLLLLLLKKIRCLECVHEHGSKFDLREQSWTYLEKICKLFEIFPSESKLRCISLGYGETVLEQSSLFCLTSSFSNKCKVELTKWISVSTQVGFHCSDILGPYSSVGRNRKCGDVKRFRIDLWKKWEISKPVHELR